MKDIINKYEAILKVTKDPELRKSLIAKLELIKERKEVLK